MIAIMMLTRDAYEIGFWIEHTKHIIFEASTVKGDNSVIENLEHILKLLTKAKLVKKYRGNISDHIRKFKRKYQGRQRLDSSDYDDITRAINQIEDAIDVELGIIVDGRNNSYRSKTTDTPSNEKVYRAGQAYEVYRDVVEIIENAQTEVFWIEPYPNSDLIRSYLENVQDDVIMRVLAKDPKPDFSPVAEKFQIQMTDRFEVRKNMNIHDRMFFVDNRCYVLGQSIKDAGKKPTYVIRVDDVSIFREIFDNLWKDSMRLISN